MWQLCPISAKEIFMSENLIPFQKHVFVCNGESCTRNGSAAVKERFVEELTKRGVLRKRKIEGDYMCTDCSSVGFCDIGPAVLVYPDGVWYAHVQPGDVAEIIESHLIGGKPVERLVKNRIPSKI
jgi:(2Fe-2S) ferredoxin